MLETYLGLDLDIRDVNAGQMALRTVVIYLFTLVVVRLGSKRFLGETTAFDVIVSIMLGSIMSRAINSSAPFFPTLGSGIILLVIHWLCAILAYRSRIFGFLFKGDAILLIKDGVVQEQGLRSAHVTLNDLTGALRLQTNQTDTAKIKLAYMERNGQISIIAYEQEPRTLTMAVENGVQTVRIVLD